MKFLIFIYILTISLNGNICQELDLDTLIANTFNTAGSDDKRPSSTTPSTNDNQEEDCECVPYYQCSENGTIIENGEDLIDIRITINQCDSYLDVCCKPGFKRLKPDTTPFIPSPTASPVSSVCGQRNFQGISSLRITGAVENEAQFGEFPWMIAVITKQQLEDSSKLVSVFQCGGSLISPSIVLTAAHCVNNKTGLNVRAGEWDTQTKKEPLPTQTSGVREVIIHEQFNPKNLHNDIALLLLDSPMELAPNVGTICLPEQGENMDGRQCVASGWGKDVFGKEGKYQVILKKVEMPTVPRDKCLQSLQKTRLGSNFRLHESFICAGGVVGKDTCKGDGGSPLACPSSTDSQIYVQSGIVAWGIGCGSETPGVYVNIAHFRNWIDNKMSMFDIDVKIN